MAWWFIFGLGGIGALWLAGPSAEMHPLKIVVLSAARLRLSGKQLTACKFDAMPQNAGSEQFNGRQFPAALGKAR